MEQPLIMPYQQLGNSDLMISRIGFGTMSLKATTNEFAVLINAAIDKGINYFDTADIYDNGVNETHLGIAIKQKRQQLIIATKAGNQIKADGTGLHWNPTKKHILAAVEQSLVRLQTDYIDLYQLHGGTIEDDIDDTISAFDLLKQQGKIRHYGISSIRPNVIRAYVERSNIVSVMMQYSLLDRRPEESCLELLKQHKIGVLARGTVAGGLLAGKPAAKYLDFQEDEVRVAAEALQLLAPQSGNSAAAALQYSVAHPSITSAVVGIRTMKQLLEAVEAIHLPPISIQQKQLLDNTLTAKQYSQHR